MNTPYSILYVRGGEIFQAGPFGSEVEALVWVADNRYTGVEDFAEYEFDLGETMVYLMRPDHSLRDLQEGDFV